MSHPATDTYDCKTPGCPGTARSNRGRFAYLCDHCKENARSTAARSAPPGPPRATIQLGIAAAARALVPKATELERQLARRRDATDAARTALASFNEALNDLKASAQAGLDGGSA